MKSSQKMVVTGSLGGLAAAVVAGSAAFACTADATIGVIQNKEIQVNAAVPAGQPFEVALKSFMPASDQNAREIAVSLINPFTGEVKQLGRYAGPGTTVTFPGAILEDAYDSGSNKPYVLQAVQAEYTRSSNIYVTNGRQFVPAATTGSTSTDAPAPTASSNQASTSVATPAGAPVQGVVAAPAGAGNAAAVPARADVKAPSAQPRAATPGLPASADAVAPVAVAAPAPSESSAPPAAELWSGLQGGKATNLLDQATSTTAPSDGVPAGAVALLGMGILSLAGVAFEASRRRLVLARVARRS